jgi:hypothetical protein
MPTNTTASLNGTGYAAESATKTPEWHGLVAWDLLFNNLTTGLFLTAALGEWALPETFLRVAKAAYPLALVFLLADLLCLVLDLGDPLRFHHMLRVFKPSSPMSLGTWCLTIYSFPLTVAAALSLLPTESPALEWLRKAAVILAFFPALGSAVYKGVLLSTNAQPGWRDARWLGGYLANSAVLLGCAGMLALSVFLDEADAIAVLCPALAILLLFNLLFLVLLLFDLRNALSRMYTFRQLWLLGMIALGAGTLAPACLVLVSRSPFGLLCAVLFLVLTCLAIRLMLLKIPFALNRKNNEPEARMPPSPAPFRRG